MYFSCTAAYPKKKKRKKRNDTKSSESEFQTMILLQMPFYPQSRLVLNIILYNSNYRLD